MPRLILITVLAALTPCMSAQRTAFHGFNRGGGAHSFSYPLALSDPLYSDFLSSTGYPVASQPPVIILQAAPAQPAAPATERVSAPPQPLMIELQGDRYVRVSGEESSSAEMIGPETIDQIRVSRPARRPSDAADRSTPAADIAPAILVFRDGHREEVTGYTIADGVLYARADYYTAGSWNQKIELSSLNLPETIQSNRSRGVKFQLPTASNEIIVGP
jgi:hypothetical protein